MIRVDAAAVLFDSDGVLVQSHQVVERSWTQLSREFGLELDGVRREVMGVRAKDTLSRFLIGSQLADAIARLEELEVEYSAHLAEIPGAGALTRSLPRDRWAIVTSASRRLGQARWRGAGIDPPPVTVTADDLTRGKPDPEPYLEAASRLGVNPRDAVIFEDSSNGAEAGHVAGARVVAVGDQEWTVEPVARIHGFTDVVVESEGSGLKVYLPDSAQPTPRMVR